MDISMPEMNGLQATRVIRQELPQSQVIIVSQNDPLMFSRQTAAVGARGFVSKSAIGRDLFSAINSALDGKDGTSGGLIEASPKIPTFPAAWFLGGGQMGERVRSFDWAHSRLGPVEHWPTSLRTAIRIILNSSYPMFVWWGKELINFYNDGYLPMLGKRHPDALGRPASEVWADVWPVVGPQTEMVLNEGRSTWNEERLLVMERNGFKEEAYFTFSYSPAPDDLGGVGGVFCAVTEDTQRVLGHRRLRVLRALAEQANQARTAEDACRIAAEILAQDPNDLPFALLYLLKPSQQHARLAGVAGLESGTPASPITVDIASSSGPWPFHRVVESGESLIVQDLSHLGILPNGFQPDRAMVLPMVKSGQGTVSGFVIAGISPMLEFNDDYRGFMSLLAGHIATAVGNARAHEEEKKRAEALAELDRAKTVFFSNISHEFRTPLTLMLGPLEDCLAAPDAVSSEQRESLELAHRNSLRLLKLVNTLLDFSRIEAGRMQATYEPTDLARLTKELASAFCSAFERARLRFIVDCSSLSEPAYVDCEMWEKIVFNLLSNAFKFTFQGEIAVGLRQVGSTAELTVRDTGIGIPADEIPELFGRFHRLKGARGRSYEGSGIGLALVQELAKLHGGSVRVESEIDQGSTFILTIPLGKDHLPADRIGAARTIASTALRGEAYVEEALRWLPQTQNVSDAATAPVPRSIVGPSPSPSVRVRPRVLLVDDNADMREYVRRLLAPTCDIETAADGEAALESIQRHLPDLILSDVMMPKLDGYGLLKVLRSRDATATVPIILLSARAGEESQVEGLEQGADDYLLKPFSARELLARVTSHLNMARIRREMAAEQSKLRRDAELLAAIVASSDDAIISKNLDGIITSWNQSAERIFGYTSKEAVGQHITLIIPRDRWDEEADIIARLRRGERVDHFETVRRRKDGTTVDLSLTISPVRDASGRVIGASKVARDITERKRAERALRESEERFRAIVETTPECVKLVSHDGTLLHMNLPGLQMVGVSSLEAVVGKSIFELIAPEDREKFKEFHQRVCTGERSSIEFDVIVLGGTRRRMESHAAPLRNPDGSLVHLAVTRDITQRKQTEEMLRQHRERIELVTKSAKIGFWFCDLPLDKLGWDSRVKEHFWLPPDTDVTIETFYERLHPEDREATRRAVEESIARGTPYDVEYRTVALDGRHKWIRASGRTSYDANGRAKRFDGLTLDITERKQAEERERQITAESVAATAKFQAVFEQTSVFAGIMRNDGVLIEANKMSLEACGYRAEDQLGRLFWDTGWWRNCPESRDKIRDAAPRVAQGIPYREILTYAWADGTERLVDFALYPIVDDNGKVLFLHPTGVDITDLKRAEENYRHLAEHLEVEVRARTIELENRNAEVLRQSEQLRELSRRLLQAQDEERRHIARELHDSAGQTLAVLGMKLTQLAQEAQKIAPDFASQAEASQELVRQLHQEIRTTSYLLHPPLLDEIGLPAALNWYVEGLQDRSNLDIKLDITEEFERLPRDLELVVFRLIQESLTNIHRHSGSKTAFITVTRDVENVCVQVQDEGAGISAERLSEIQSRGSGVGIRGMRERVQQFHGVMNIESNGRGTKIIATIPITKPSLDRKDTAVEPLQATA